MVREHYRSSRLSISGRCLRLSVVLWLCAAARAARVSFDAYRPACGCSVVLLVLWSYCCSWLSSLRLGFLAFECLFSVAFECFGREDAVPFD